MSRNSKTDVHLKNGTSPTFAERQEHILQTLQRIEWELDTLRTHYGTTTDEHITASVERIQRELSHALPLQHAIWSTANQ